MMAKLTEFLHNPVPDNRRSGACSGLIIALVFAALLGRQRRSLEQLQDISNNMNLQESFVRTNLNLRSVANRLQNLNHSVLNFQKIMNLVR